MQKSKSKKIARASYKTPKNPWTKIEPRKNPMPNFRAIKALNDITRKIEILSNGVFVFFYSSRHLEWERFLHLVIIVTTLETHKCIFCYNNNIMQNDNSTCKQDYPEQEHYEQPYKVIHRLPLLDNMGELSQTFRLFWISPKIPT